MTEHMQYIVVPVVVPVRYSQRASNPLCDAIMAFAAGSAFLIAGIHEWWTEGWYELSIGFVIAGIVLIVLGFVALSQATIWG